MFWLRSSEKVRSGFFEIAKSDLVGRWNGACLTEKWCCNESLFGFLYCGPVITKLVIHDLILKIIIYLCIFTSGIIYFSHCLLLVIAAAASMWQTRWQMYQPNRIWLTMTARLRRSTITSPKICSANSLQHSCLSRRRLPSNRECWLLS